MHSKVRMYMEEAISQSFETDRVPLWDVVKRIHFQLLERSTYDHGPWLIRYPETEFHGRSEKLVVVHIFFMMIISIDAIRLEDNRSRLTVQVLIEHAPKNPTDWELGTGTSTFPRIGFSMHET